MAIIKRIVTGQTFGNWLDTTNKMIDDLNAANAVRNIGRLVRYDSGGSIGTNTLRLRDFHLDSNTAISINTLSSDFSDPAFENDNTIFTAKATYEAIKAEAKNIIKNAAGHATSGEFVRVNTDNVETRIGGTQYIVTSAANTTFNHKVIVDGDLEVLGDSTEFTTQVLNIQDNNIVLNKGGTTYTAESGGFDIEASNAFFRLVDSGNRFPYSASDNTINVQLHIDGKRRSYKIEDPRVSGYTNLSSSHFLNPELIAGSEEIRNININTKDTIVLEYRFDGTPNANLVPLAIGTVLGGSRESAGNVLEPDPINYTNTANSEITYQIGTDYFTDYASYKAAFLLEPIDSSKVVRLAFNPEDEKSYYYWAGLIPASTYLAVTTTLASGTYQSNIYKDGINPSNIIAPNASNYDYDISLGDEIKISVDLSASALPLPPFIGLAPFAEDNATPGPHNESLVTATRANTVNLIGPGHATLDDAITYEVDGTSYPTATAYASAAASGSTANVIFRPSTLKYADQYQYYYWNTANNYTAPNDFGGEIRVSANNTGMGGEIETLYPMGLSFEKEITDTGTSLEFDGVDQGDFELDAGDTLKLTSTALPLFVDTYGGTTPMDHTDGVTYEADGTTFGNHTDFDTYISTHPGALANTYFTALVDGAYTYQIPAIKATGKITVKPRKARNLSSFSLSTDNKTATIENPRSFNVTKNHNPILQMDGNFADFSGTKRGLQLPADALSHSAANGVIRYNNGIGLFEGFTGGTWRGLGGVIDLDQDTQIRAGDADNTLYFEAFANTVAEMRANGFYLDSATATVGSDTGTANVFSNWTLPARYEINVDGIRDYSGTLVTGLSRFEMNPDGIKLEATGYLKIPVGDIGERPPSSVAETGMIRYAKDRFRVQLYDGSGNVTTKQDYDSIEMWNADEGDWKNITSVTSEYTQTASASQGTWYDFTNCLETWHPQDLDIYLNGLRLSKNDYDLNPPSTPVTSSPNITNRIDFSPVPRAAGQVITVVHTPSAKLGVTTIDAVSRTEIVSSGLPSIIAVNASISGTSRSTDVSSGALTVAGGLGVAGDIFTKSITETSSLALKENISQIDSALDKVIKLKGVEFSWKDEKNSKEYGLIAEEVSKVTPQLVSEGSKGVKYSKVVALLVEAIKQQQDQIDDLKSQLPKKRVRKTKS